MPLSEKKTGGAVVAATSKLKPGASSEAAAPGGKPVETLQCPRCESMNTKFCYYNNYSVTQPRHFCRQCQRYWTAGGILRNVPVGGGSRKKNRAPYPRMEPYTLGMHHGMHHRVQGSMLAHPASGIMGAFPPAGFPHLVTPDMAAFGGHPHHYVPTHAPPDQRNQPNAFHPPGVMYATSQGPSVALQIGSGGTGLTFELNLAAAENNPPPATQSGTQSQANATTLSPSQGRLLSGQSPSVNSMIVPVAGTITGGADHVDARLNPGGSSKTTASPPHGDSTIEEESSTPTNGYSNNGYEEGDAVSSMWHEMHDMDNVLFQ